MSNDKTLDEVLSNPELREALQKVVAHEEAEVERMANDPVYKDITQTPYWSLLDIPVEWPPVKKLMFAGVVDRPLRRWYILKDRDTVKQALAQFEQYQKALEEKTVKVIEEGVPSDLFDIIEGFDDVKEFFCLSLSAEEPVPILLVGPPGTAKTLFLMELERLGGRFITAGTATKVGIRDIIYDELPRILIIDEIEKISSSDDLSSLLTWMESGRIIITKYQFRDERKGSGWVFAACNTTKRLPPELLDRFQVFHIKPYTKDQFIRVVTGFLTKRMHVDLSRATYIAEKVQEYSVSVREAVRIARLAKTREQIDHVIKIVMKYRG